MVPGEKTVEALGLVKYLYAWSWGSEGLKICKSQTQIRDNTGKEQVHLVSLWQLMQSMAHN